MAKGWRLQDLTCVADPWIVFWRQITSNLLGVVPEGRPISLCNVAFFGTLVPSGIVYGGIFGGCGCELGGDGPTCVSVICCRVLLALSGDLIVILNF
jgi:hypothetical protein